MCLYIYICSVRRLGTSANLLLRRFITHCSCSFFSVRRPGSWRGPGARFFSSSAWQDGGAWGTQLPVDNSERCELVLFGNWCCVCMSYIYFECRGDLWKFKDTITWDEQGRMRLYSSGSACWCSDWHTHLFPSASWSEPKWWMGTSLGVQHFWKNEGTFQTTIKEFPGRGRWMSAGVPGIEPTARLYRTAPWRVVPLKLWTFLGWELGEMANCRGVTPLWDCWNKVLLNDVLSSFEWLWSQVEEQRHFDNLLIITLLNYCFPAWIKWVELVL